MDGSGDNASVSSSSDEIPMVVSLESVVRQRHVRSVGTTTDDLAKALALITPELIHMSVEDSGTQVDEIQVIITSPDNDIMADECIVDKIEIDGTQDSTDA